ncbi:MAG TPA: 30S ribosomal protein S13, partial [Nitrososphaerales archaeon]|nr:30S ribosomal protein S13 [Nitrososphaerales archaeon]
MSGSQASEFRYLVRVKGKDLDGRKKAVAALADLKGVGYNFAQAVVSGAGIDPKMRFGSLSEAQVREIERVLSDTSSLNVPQWAFNRKRDPETGETKQLIGSDLDLANREDVERERNIQSWRGVRHSLGLK